MNHSVKIPPVYTNETLSNKKTNLLLPLIEVRQTFESSFDDATEAFIPDDLVEAITNGRKSDVDVDIKSHFRLHLST